MNRKPETVMEKRAAAWCENLKLTSKGYIVVEWIKSKIWGRCARIMDCQNEKIAHAGGCGYDKESAVLAELLCWLDDRITGCSGAGVQTVQRKCTEAGWRLENITATKHTDTYLIQKII